MRALQIDEYGAPEVLRLRDIALPTPDPDEVLVRIAFSGINFMDVYTRLGRYATAGAKSGHYQTALPLTLGIEGAGRIVAVGRNVTCWQVGDRVAYALARGSYAEYAAVPARQIARVPDGVGLDVAAAAMFQGLTADYLVDEVACITDGRSCLVHSGAGGIGQLIIQLAKNVGATVIATGSSPQKRAIAASCGASAVAGPDSDAFVAACLQATGGAGVDVVFDSVGAPAFTGNLRALRRKGLFVHYGANGGPLGAIDPMRLADSGSLYFTRPRLADYVADAETVSRRADHIFSALLKQRVRVTISNVCSFDEVGHAHRELEERQAIGKSVLAVDRTVL